MSYKLLGDTDYTIAKEVTQTEGIIDGLTIDKTYSIQITAVRGTDETTATAEVKVTQEAQRAWALAAFGSGVNTTDNFFTVNALDGIVTVISRNGKGTLVPASTYGLACYYTTIDVAYDNFSFIGNVTVDSWTYPNVRGCV